MGNIDQEAKKAEQSEDLKISELNFPVVGLGASAGGLDPLQRFFENTPSDCGMAFVVVLHLSPKHESSVDAILRGSTAMRVIQVTQSLRIEANHIYVIAPNKQLQMNDGHIELLPMARPRGRHIAIDLFFRTLAKTHGTRAISIVLSGSGADGAAGIACIKEGGGITFAQSPDEAEYESMPQSAIDTGAVDFVLPVVDIPQRMVELWRSAQAIRLPAADDGEVPGSRPTSISAAQEAEEAMRDIMLVLRERTGHDFQHYKRATVLRRIERRLQVNLLTTLPAYRDFMRQSAAEPAALLKDLLISVTNFFRDREAFDALEREVIEPLSAARDANDAIRVWSAGCATGEEAYSLSMVLSEHAAARSSAPQIQVFATDIDDAALTVARNGFYPQSIVSDVTPTRLRQFLVKEHGYYRVNKSIRDKVLFTKHDLLRDTPFSKLDLICCRNLLIYLNREIQAEILKMFHFALKPGGILFLGSSESADAVPKHFSVLDKKHRIYRSNVLPWAGRSLPALPIGSFQVGVLPTKSSQLERPRVMLEDLHRRALERHAPPSILVDREHSVVHVSDRAARFLRYTAGTPTHDLLRIVHPELRLELRSALFQAAQSGNSVESRRIKLDLDGRVSYVNIIVRPLTEAAAVGDFTLVLFDKVEPDADFPAEASDERKDRLLLQMEAELQRYKLQLQDVIEQSETATEELKASNEELQATNEELRSASEELETGREELQSVNEELVTVNHDLKIKVDETAQVNDDLQNLIASTDIATVFIDSAMRIQRFTPRALDLFNLIAVDIGRPLPHITHCLNYPELAFDAAEVFARLRPIEREVEGNGRWYIARIMPYRTADHRIDGAVLTFFDISRLKETVASEQQARAEAQEAVARKDEFLAVMSHELKHPLNLIQVNAELLTHIKETRNAPQVRGVVETIRRAVTGQARIIDDMLDLSRMHTGKLLLEQVAVDLVETAKVIVDAVQHHAAAQNLQVTLTSDSEKLIVLADPVRVEQIIWNLVGNAIKFCPGKGRVDLRVSIDETFVRLDISDTGIGIRPEFLIQVFQMFRQADVGTTRKEGGLGIGLALVEQLVRLQGGRVTASSEGLGLGATFSFWLPLYAGPVEVKEAIVAATGSLLTGQRILLVDDNADALESFAMLLQLNEAQVWTAVNGARALQLIKDRDFDLLLSDIGMPDMDGYALITAIRKGSRNQRVLAIAVTGYGRQNDIDRAVAAGFDAHVSKPISVDALTTVLARLKNAS